jgi:hypothetical protein
MKVKCIKGGGWYFANSWVRKHWWSKKKRKPANGPKKDDIVTVKEEFWSDGELYYRLVEWPRKDNAGYDASCFVPLQEPTTEYKEVDFTEIKKKTPIPSTN